MKKIYFLPFIFFAFLITASPSAFAQSDNTKNTNAKPKTTDIKDNNKQVKTVACEKMQEKIQQRIQSYDANKKAKEDLYEKIKQKVSDIIVKLQGKGLDTTKLSADLLLLNSKIENYWTNRQAVISKLEESSQYSCEIGDKQAFKTKLNEAKELHKLVLANAKDIRNFLINTIKNDISALQETLTEK